MKCEAAVLALDAAHDERQAPPAEVLAHLELCPACAAYAAFLADLPVRVASLPREMAPDRDLWTGIRARIAGDRAVDLRTPHKTRASFAPWWAVAAALFVAAAGGILWMRSPVPSVSSPAVATEASGATAAALPASYETGAIEFTRATTDLLSALDARRDSMTPETRAVVERNLAVIDEALLEIKSALARDPGNRDLLRLLGATRKRKIETLQLVVKLTA